MNDADFQYRIYRFNRPLAPGATGSIRFRTERRDRGFTANDGDNRLVANGSFLGSWGSRRWSAWTRVACSMTARSGANMACPPSCAPQSLRTARRSGATISARTGYVPISRSRPTRTRCRSLRAARSRTRSRTAGAPRASCRARRSSPSSPSSPRVMPSGRGWRTACDCPSTTTRTTRSTSTGCCRRWRPRCIITAAISGRISSITRGSSSSPAIRPLRNHSRARSPSERFGFAVDVRSPDRVDYVTYVTAHELGHQYWAHQVISADMKGGTLWVETMAQYSALMVMKQIYGPDRIRRFLKYELDDYQRGRRGKAVAEQPLARVENQAYIHYNKGSLALYLLQDRLGEARVNHMLAGLLDRYRFRGRPYPRSTDLIDGFASLARTPEERLLVADLFDRITLWDLKARTATTRRLPNGRWETLLTMDAAKFYADGQGNEKPTPVAETLDVGAFTARPGYGAFSRADVLAMEQRPFHSGVQQVRLVTARRPTFVGVDPYNKFIDRNGDDDVVPVGSSVRLAPA